MSKEALQLLKSVSFFLRRVFGTQNWTNHAAKSVPFLMSDVSIIGSTTTTAESQSKYF
jgi:hypothetical protein